MNKKHIFYIFSFLAALSVIFFLLGYFSLGQKVYINQKYGFSLIYSFDWKEKDLAKSGLDNYLAFKIENEKYKAFFQVMVEEKKEKINISYDELAKRMNDSMPKELENFQKISSRKILIDKKEALEYKYQYTYKTESGEKRETKQVMVIFVNLNKIYYLTGQSPQSSFSHVEQEFNKIVKSFKINK
ncbi:hypothetical protein AUJ93_01080 [bacterium CG2_30_33_46]|nr:MAG: hypothetical protein AUJ93_01080 [bacterium CG2_30_33_46]PIY85681.1 MAG: hypothetical protein COY76_00835 [bacterium CG_4_10_14_0_8_um_filter_33_57]